jgi:hypothetical protein
MANHISRKQVEGALVARAMTSKAFRDELLADPRGALERELGFKLPAGVNVKIVEEDENNLYVVLPQAPPQGLAEADLEMVAGGGNHPLGTPYPW